MRSEYSNANAIDLAHARCDCRTEWRRLRDKFPLLPALLTTEHIDMARNEGMILMLDTSDMLHTS